MRARLPPPTALVFAENVRKLMDHHGVSQAQLQRDTGVGQSSMSGVLGSASGSQNPRAETMGKIAARFKVAPWRLLVPDATVEFLLDPYIERLTQVAAQLDQVGRTMLLNIGQDRLTALSKEGDDSQDAAA